MTTHTDKLVAECMRLADEATEARLGEDRAGSMSSTARYHEARTALEASIRALVPDGWQPIETAPRGTSILLWVPTSYGKVNSHIAITGQTFDNDVAPSWLAFNADEALQRVEPTHWMPLPAAPSLPEADR